MFTRALFLSHLNKNVVTNQLSSNISGTISTPYSFNSLVDVISVSDAQFIDITGSNTEGGGAVSCTGPVTYEFTISKSYFNSCFSTGSNSKGGAILSLNSVIYQCIDSCFTECLARSGHFQYLSSSNGSALISQSSCINNNAESEIGDQSTYINSPGIYAENANFSSNSVNGVGAAFSAIANYNLVLQLCSFIDNYGISTLHLNGDPYACYVQHDNFIDNTGNSLISVVGDFIISSSCFSNEKIQNPFLIYEGTLKLKKCAFNENFTMPTSVSIDKTYIQTPELYQNQATELEECHASAGGIVEDIKTPGPTPAAHNWGWGVGTILLLILIVFVVVAIVIVAVYIIRTCFCKVPKVYRTVKQIEENAQEKGLLDDQQEPIVEPIQLAPAPSEPQEPPKEVESTPEPEKQIAQSPSRVQIILSYTDESEKEMESISSGKSDIKVQSSSTEPPPQRVSIIKEPSDTEEEIPQIPVIEIPHDENMESDSTITDPASIISHERDTEKPKEKESTSSYSSKALDKPLIENLKAEDEDKSDSYYSYSNDNSVPLQVSPMPNKLDISESDSDTSSSTTPKKHVKLHLDEESEEVPLQKPGKSPKSNDSKPKRSYAGDDDESYSYSSPPPMKPTEKTKDSKPKPEFKPKRSYAGDNEESSTSTPPIPKKPKKSDEKPKDSKPKPEIKPKRSYAGDDEESSSSPQPKKPKKPEEKPKEEEKKPKSEEPKKP